MTMSSRPNRFLCWLLRAAAWAVLLPCPVRAGDDWKFDVVHLKNGKTFAGLLLGETPSEVRFQCVRRNPGAPTLVVFTTFQRTEIDTIDKLDSKDREVLAGRLKALDPTGKGEAVRMEALVLKKVPWIQKDRGDGLEYRSVHFVLVSNAREDIVRRAAVRLEQIYTAYTRFLPPRQESARPTTILLIRSLAEYQDYLKGKGRQVLNAAFYDTALNEVVCASNLQRLGEALERARKHHAETLSHLRQQEADIRRDNQGRVPASVRGQIEAARRQVMGANARNNKLFSDATRRQFRTLYHEAFHAYLANFVYPPTEAAVPRWLNEGLAQIFETAVVEAGELRVGHADADRLAQFRDTARKDDWLPLVDILRAGPKQFIVAHASDKQVSNGYYLHSWALAFYLTFDRKLLGTPALDRYVRALKHGSDPAEAFRNLVREPLPAFETKFHAYVQNLRPDGSVAGAAAGKGAIHRE